MGESLQVFRYKQEHALSVKLVSETKGGIKSYIKFILATPTKTQEFIFPPKKVIDFCHHLKWRQMYFNKGKVELLGNEKRFVPSDELGICSVKEKKTGIILFKLSLKGKKYWVNPREIKGFLDKLLPLAQEASYIRIGAEYPATTFKAIPLHKIRMRFPLHDSSSDKEGLPPPGQPGDFLPDVPL